MSINNYSALTNLTTSIINPNGKLGILIEEIPSDIGRSWEGYKRGGIIEGAEKMRRELMGAAVWLGGIPVFKAIFDKVFEKLLKVPMKMDFSNAKEGNDAIGDTLKYIFKNENPKGLDVSEIKPKYIAKFRKLAKDNINIEELAKKVSTGKKITATVAVIFNCIMMGVILPKINQKITKNMLKEKQRKQYSPNFASMDEFKKKNKTNKNISFTGFFDTLAKDIKTNGFFNTVGYRTENDNTFRLLSTDIPMIIGRIATSRNKYEGIENGFMDTSSIFFYNFCSGLVQKGLRKISPSVDIKPAVSETFANFDNDTLKNAFEALEENQSVNSIKDIFSPDAADKLYSAGTFGKYGKINKFVKNSDLEEINKSVIKFMNHIKNNQTEANPLFKDGVVNMDLIKDLTKKTNVKNAGFLGLGLLSSIIGLAVIVPKTTFWITKMLTGRNEFTGIAKYDDEDKKAKNSVVA